MMKHSIRQALLVLFLALLGGAAAGLQGSGYLGCADGCRGSYCWGSTSGSKGCMEAAFNTCVLFYTELCPPWICARTQSPPK